MSNDDRNLSLNKLKDTLAAVNDKKVAQKTLEKSPSLWLPFLKMGVFLLALYYLLMFGINSIESSFLARTADYENKLRSVAEKSASLLRPAEASKVYQPKVQLQNARPLICWSKPDADGRMIARIHYNLPEKRQPQSPEEVDLIVRLTLKSDRIYVSNGKFRTKFPIYDIVVDYIDPGNNVIFKSDIIKGDPTSSEDSANRIAPGTVPMAELQLSLQKTLFYEAAFAWHRIQ